MLKNDFVSIPVTLGSDVANAGTFTAAYPAGYTAGDFSGAAGHYLSLNGTKLLQPQSITLSFGASTVTVTNGTGDAMLAGQKGALQLEIRGKAFPGAGSVPNGHGPKALQVSNLPGVVVDFGSPATLATAGIMAAKSVGATATSFAVSDFVSATSGNLDVPRNVTLLGSSGGDQVVTVNGFDAYDQPMSETLTASGTNVIQGLKAFARVTGATVAAGGSASKTIALGWGDYLGLPIRVKDELQITAEQIADVIKRRELVRLGFQHTEAEMDAAAVRYLAPGFAGKVIDAGIVLEDTVTTGGAMAYAVGSTTIVGLANTIANGATAGVFYSDTPTNDGTEYFLSTDYLTVTPAGAINASAPVTEWMTVLKTDGKLATGQAKNTKATATTGDVRGTWKPNAGCDGTTSFALHVQAADVYDLGNYQYTAV